MIHHPQVEQTHHDYKLRSSPEEKGLASREDKAVDFVFGWGVDMILVMKSNHSIRQQHERSHL